jgi:hypothetical protein
MAKWVAQSWFNIIELNTDTMVVYNGDKIKRDSKTRAFGVFENNKGS